MTMGGVSCLPIRIPVINIGRGTVRCYDILYHRTSMVCLGELTEGGIGSRGVLWLAKGLFLNFCWVRGESCRVTSFLGFATSLAECWDASFCAFLQFVGGSSVDDDSSEVREGLSTGMPLGTALRHFLLWLCQEKQFIVRNSLVVGSSSNLKLCAKIIVGGWFLHINVLKIWGRWSQGSWKLSCDLMPYVF